ncbi:hypothetical protein [Brachybacterium sp.]|uniref:hypothetical protein n=1 Tax=Brachybacterium sp. TaxID=1891286 RepID=UPI002ED12158
MTPASPPAPALAPSRTQRGVGRWDPLEPRGLVRLLAKPAAFLGANWAAMLGILTVVGIVPALAGATRVTGDLAEHRDSAFTSTLEHMRRTLRRDAPASGALLLVCLGIAMNAVVLPAMAPSARVFAVGAVLPVTWVLVALLSAYVVVAASDQRGDRSTIVWRALSLTARRPVTALAAPALIALLAPLWLLAPLTIACGFSVPPWVLARAWGGLRPDRPRDAGPG